MATPPKAAKLLGEMLEKRGQKVVLHDLARCDMAEAVEDAYRYDKLVVASVSYDARCDSRYGGLL